MPTHDKRHFTDHSHLWLAIDRVAALNNISVSALAKKCGLDATAFNRSKRFDSYGKPRWLSTMSLCKVLHANGMTWTEFVGILDAVKEEQQSQ
jgi:phage repressor protein C with HTH and peptisase S24 domain